MPRPDDFFISLKDGVGTSSKINSLTSTVTSATVVKSDEDRKHAPDEITSEGNKVNCKHKFGQNDGSDVGRSDSMKIDVNDSGNIDGKSENVSGPLESDKRSDDEKEEDDGSDDDFEEVGTLENGEFTQEHGLFDRKFALTVELGHGGSRLQETEDNQDLIQGVRDQYMLIKTKYLPAVKRWLQVSN